MASTYDTSIPTSSRYSLFQNHYPSPESMDVFHTHVQLVSVMRLGNYTFTDAYNIPAHGEQMIYIMHAHQTTCTFNY